MQIHNRFEVPMPPDEAWPFLMDIASTVPCFPGAELVEQVDGNVYRGRVTVKLGPLAMVFNGRLTIEARDEAARSAVVRASWTESKGRGNAITVTRFAMRAGEGEGDGKYGAGTAVDIDTDVQLAGQVAQYGRGVGVISDISAQLVAKFAENLRASIGADPEAAGSPERARSDIDGVRLLGRALMNRVKKPSA